MNNTIQPTRFKKVLIIDDDEMDIFISKRIIEGALFAEEVVMKASTASALDYLENLIQASEPLPDIIFLDLNMPGKDGFAFLERLVMLDAENEIDFRIVILTNVADKIRNEKAQQYRMVEAVLEKPLNPDVLLRLK